LILAVGVLVAAPRCLGGDEQGGYAGSFMDWGIGSRAIALGKTFSTVANDGSALFWNPAGLQQITRRELDVLHAIIFEDRMENYAGFSYPFPMVTISAGWLRFGVDDIQERNTTGDLVGQFSDAENLFLLGAGTSIWNSAGMRLNAGLSLKYFYHSLYNFHGTGWGGDIGTIFSYDLESPVKRVGVSFVVQNIGASVKWNTDSGHKDNVPLNVRLGSAVEGELVPVTLAVDLEKKQHQDVRVHAGAEYTWQVLSLRVGLNQTKFSGGVGIAISLEPLEFIVDYAFTTDDVSENALHFFTLAMKF